MLGYPRIISVENFRTPNFALVADILYWLVYRFDPNSRISDEIETEKDRIYFVTQVAQSMASHAHLKLNCKRLYAADGHAVRELLKVARLLKKAQDLKETKDDDDENAMHATPAEIDQTRKLGEEITESGVKLNGLLVHEDENKEDREKALRFLDSTRESYNNSGSEMEYVKNSIRQIIIGVDEQVTSLEKQCEDFAHDEKKISKEIRKKRTELERHEKRLKSLESVRPAFMDEYEKLEVDLKREYEVYLEKFRNLDYLEHRLSEMNAAEALRVKQAERALKLMQQRLNADVSPEDQFITPDNDEPEPTPEAADDKAAAGSRKGKKKPEATGNMVGGSSSESMTPSSGSGSESDTDSESWGQVSLQNSDSEDSASSATATETDESDTGSGSESYTGSESGSSSGEF